MIKTIDTNIFIYSIYDGECNRAIKKFLDDENRGPIPCYLHQELVNKVTTLFWLLRSISVKLERGESTHNILEIGEIKKDFSNIYDFLFNSRSKGDIKKIINKKVDYAYSLTSWLDKIKYYPNDEQEEKGILDKYKDNKKRLLIFEELHNADLKIIVIFHHYCSKKVMTKGVLISKDKSLLKRKNEIKREFDFVDIIDVKRYLSDGNDEIIV